MRRTEEERFWAKVERLGPEVCWNWKASTSNYGYGAFWFRSRLKGAHVASWIMANGKEVPKGMEVLHSCDNPPCVNPAHLSLGTRTENMRQASARGRVRNQNTDKMVCPLGHPLDGVNNIGGRFCYTCQNARAKAYREANRETINTRKREARARAKSKPDGEVPGFRD
jgi:hypothetical protein